MYSRVSKCMILPNLTFPQKIFLLNVAINDLLMSLVGMFRGLGIVSSIFLNPAVENEVNGFCPAYAIFMNSVT